MNQLWSEVSRNKLAGTAMNIAENANTSETALKLTE